MLDYKIIYGDDAGKKGFEDAIKDALMDGFCFAGNLVIVPDGELHYFYQPMILNDRKITEHPKDSKK